MARFRIFVLVVVWLVLGGCATTAEDRVAHEPTPKTTATSHVAPETTAAPEKTSSTEDRTALAQTEWVLRWLGSQRPPKGTEFTLNFEVGVARGRAGCNYYGFDYEATEGGKFRDLPGWSHTAIGCPKKLARWEEAYLDALGSAAAYRRREDHLELRDASGETTLVYEMAGGERG
jgi:heat shock protein HslJ